MGDAFTDSPIVKNVEQALVTEGEKIVIAWLIAQLPWLGSAFLSPFVSFIAGLVVKFVVKELDHVAFAGYVAVKTGRQVTDFIKAVDLGDQQAIDQAAHDLIRIGKT